jgi:hypothetical protein
MRPRISNFGKITREELDKFLLDNKVYGFLAKRLENEIIYSYHIMFRHNKKQPELLYVKVSAQSKYVLSAWTDNHIFKTIDELKNTYKLP